jgi:hypothetical protein
MNLHDFLSHPDVELPLSRPDVCTDGFPGFVRDRLGRFRAMVSKLDASPIAGQVQARASAIERCCEDIHGSVELSLKGRLPEAYAQFDKAVQDVLDELKGCTVPSGIIPFLYRIRQIRRTTMPPLRREDLFHIPFEKRHKVPSDRYSIPGLPCLYLSGSLYTCWEELGRPPFHEVQAAAFWLKDPNSVKILNFANVPAHFLSCVNANDVEPVDGGLTKQDVERHISMSLVLWPLMASSSITEKHRRSPFKPEYLIPQMLLQWLRNNDEFDGVCYFSTNVRARSTPSVFPLCNFAFPAKQIKPTGWCNHLCRMFRMTEPYGWEWLRAVQVGDRPAIPQSRFAIELIEGIEVQYEHSEFGAVEAWLNNRALKIMRETDVGDPHAGQVGNGS